jgi:dihydroneopterin aldolase
MSKVEINIGVENYHFFLSKHCTGQSFGQLALSFSLEGDFLAAAVNDDLSRTVDYYEACQAVKKRLYPLSCKEIASIKEQALMVFHNFSPLITKSYVKITALCHGALIVEEGLLVRA